MLDVLVGSGGVAVGELDEGLAVALYPEGTRSPDGRLYKGKTGMARIALQNRVPIVPVGISGSKSFKGPFGIPWAKRPVVVIGKPLDFSRYYGRVDDPRTLRWVTDQVMAAIHELSGQTYVEAYGTSVKSGSLTEAEAAARILERPGINTKEPELPA